MHIVRNNADNCHPVTLTKNKQPSFISGWQMRDTSLCDRLMKWVDDPIAELTKESGPGEIGRREGLAVDTDVKDSFDRHLDYGQEVVRDYSQYLQGCLDMYLVEFPAAGRVAEFSDVVDCGNVQRYRPKAAYHAWHTESCNKFTMHRHLVFMTYLNDVTDGGETEFSHQKLKVKPRKGLTLIWPSDWTHEHRGVPSPTQVKYIATGWYSYM